MLSSKTRCASPLPIPSLPSVLFTCLHLIPIQNGLTPLEVAGAKQDDDEVEKKRQLQLDPHYMWRRSREPKYHSYEDYRRVIDLLGPEQDITPPQQDSSTVIEDTPPSPTQVRQSHTSLHMYTQVHCTGTHVHESSRHIFTDTV